MTERADRAWGPDRKAASDAAFVAALDAIDEAIEAHTRSHEKATGVLDQRLSGIVGDLKDEKERQRDT